VAFDDRDLTCAECSQTFVFTADDQQYHNDKGYTNEPKRCPDCRRSRRVRYNEGGGSGGYGGGPRQMHSITCDQCGKDAEVPFLPRGDRPVYCGDCYSSQRGSSGSSSRY